MKQDAEKLFTEIFFRTTKRFSEIITFRWFNNQALPHVKDLIVKEHNEFVHDLSHGSEYAEFFTDRNGFFDKIGGADSLVESMVREQVETYQSSIDASSLVLAHSAIDASAFDYLRVIGFIAPIDQLEHFVIKKTITLEELKEKTHDEILKDKITKFIVGLERESLLSKIDKLFQICKPPAKFSPIKKYTYDRHRLVKLDELRHEIVHGEGLKSPMIDCDNEIIYMNNTANLLMALLNHAYGLKLNPYHIVFDKMNNSNKANAADAKSRAAD